MAKAKQALSEFDTIAAIDLGSNSFHMIVAQIVDGQLRVLDRMREMVRLAAGLDKDNNLSPEAQQRAIECLQRFGQRLREMPPGSVRAVGTNTLRKARTSKNFLAAASAALGHPIEVIAGVEEARLIYLGVSHGLPASDERRLVVDIGGGSTECIIGRQFEPQRMESLYMGCVSFSQAFFPEGIITEKKMRKAMLAARLELQTIENVYRRIGWGEAIGASGTIKAVGEVVNAMGWCNGPITRQALRRLAEALIDAGDINKVTLEGMKDERRPVFAGGVAVLLSIFESLDIESMQVSDWALREGLLFDLLGRIRHEDVRERTITSLSERYAVDVAQAMRVEQTVQDMLVQVGESWSFDDECSQSVLHWAARLHEVGVGIAHNQYHKHGHYLLQNSDMPGFSRQEQEVLAIIVRAHRRKFPVSLFKELPAEQAGRVQRLAILLRIAILLHRSRSEVELPPIRYMAGENSLDLIFPFRWLDDHPLTRADLEEEAALLNAASFTLGYS